MPFSSIVMRFIRANGEGVALMRVKDMVFGRSDYLTILISWFRLAFDGINVKRGRVLPWQISISIFTLIRLGAVFPTSNVIQ